MIRSYRIGRFGVGFASINGNHHGPNSTTLKSTVKFYSLGDGGRMTVYRKDGSFLEFDIYWRHWRANKKKCPLPPPGWWCSREAGHPNPCAARKLTLGQWLRGRR